MAQFSLIPPDEATDLAADIHELFDDLARSLDQELRASSGECHPSLDVLQTDAGLEVTVDVAGVPAAAIRVLFRGGVLLIAGEKAPPRPAPEQSFHRVERDFGRFARAVRIEGAFDIALARATLVDGELTVKLPKREERRGRAHRITVS
jgi:HSP20 family protein